MTSTAITTATDAVSITPSTDGVPITSAPDRVFLRELAVECVIGFLDWERLVKQTVYVDVELPIDCRRASRSDDVADTLDYKRLAKRIIGFIGTSEFKLVETLAHRTALVILREFDVPWVRLTLNKRGAIRGSRDVGVCIERVRADLAAEAGPAGPQARTPLPEAR
ncbi:MAG TPA: dihydroneopterin aldolase [Steroidobacteraceae bacterium]|nr:dihydroneopterin aldolase [Steroidobacteraceae bacterium]